MKDCCHDVWWTAPRYFCMIGYIEHSALRNRSLEVDHYQELFFQVWFSVISIQFNSIYFVFVRSKGGCKPTGYRTCQYIGIQVRTSCQ